MGFNVTDIEPFVSKDKYGRKAGDKPAYEDYDLLEKKIESGEIEKFDYIISNAVLNVLPQDERDNMVAALGHLVKDGGKIFVNVISKDYQTAKDAKEPTAKNSKGQPYWKISKSGNPTGSNLITEAKGDTGREVFVWSSNSPQKVFSKSELSAYLKDALGDSFTVSNAPKGIGMTAVVLTKNGSDNNSRRFSLRSNQTESMDREYMDAVRDNDTEKMRKLVEIAAKKAGYKFQMYHQTDADNIHIFDLGIGTNGGTDSETPYGIFTKRTMADIGLGKYQMPLYVKSQKRLTLYDRTRIRQEIPDAIPYLDAIKKIDKEYEQIYEEANDKESEAIDKWSEEHPDVDFSTIIVEDFLNRTPFKDSKEVMDAYNETKRIEEEWDRKVKELSVKSKKAITKFLKDNGYDSMYISFDEGSGGRETDSLILLNPEQVKSADLITRDDEGNIIPLSERFNKNKKDVRYSLRNYVDLNEIDYKELAILRKAINDRMNSRERKRIDNNLIY